MRTSDYSNPFQYASAKSQPLLQGRKASPRPSQPEPVYYAPMPVLMGQPATANTTSAPTQKGIFGQLKAKIWHMVSEEASTERPIGISQLTRKTFNVRQEVAEQSFFKSGQTMQDYRFSQIAQPRR